MSTSGQKRSLKQGNVPERQRFEIGGQPAAPESLKSLGLSEPYQNAKVQSLGESSALSGAVGAFASSGSSELTLKSGPNGRVQSEGVWRVGEWFSPGLAVEAGACEPVSAPANTLFTGNLQRKPVV